LTNRQGAVRAAFDTSSGALILTVVVLTFLAPVVIDRWTN
jgi:hypothetical protein